VGNHAALGEVNDKDCCTSKVGRLADVLIGNADGMGE
jgi:hypothetical protein